jgi:hypothetical protein
LLQLLNGDCIGGFTSLSWSSSNNTNYPKNLDNSAFLLNLTRRRQFYNTTGLCPITYLSASGPIFGAIDFLIIPPFNCGHTLQSYTNQKHFQIPLIDGIN